MKLLKLIQGKKRLVWSFSLALVFLLALAVLFTSAASASAAATTHRIGHGPHVSQWSPTGHVWTLTVNFVQGSRQGQSEVSQMTFLPDGHLTAIFPGPTPDSPPTQPPAIDGSWSMTGPSAFHYQFKDPILQGDTLVAYVQVQINAFLVSSTAYVAGGVGAAYAVATGLPIPGQYNVTSTVAVTG